MKLELLFMRDKTCILKLNRWKKHKRNRNKCPLSECFFAQCPLYDLNFSSPKIRVMINIWQCVIFSIKESTLSVCDMCLTRTKFRKGEECWEVSYSPTGLSINNISNIHIHSDCHFTEQKLKLKKIKSFQIWKDFCVVAEILLTEKGDHCVGDWWQRFSLLKREITALEIE